MRAKDCLSATALLDGLYLFIWATSLLRGNFLLPDSHYWSLLLTLNGIGLGTAFILRIFEVRKNGAR